MPDMATIPHGGIPTGKYTQSSDGHFKLCFKLSGGERVKKCFVFRRFGGRLEMMKEIELSWTVGVEILSRSGSPLSKI